MALHIINSFCRQGNYSSHITRTSRFKDILSISKCTTIEIDPLDTFTTQLLQKKVDNWHIKTNKVNKSCRDSAKINYVIENKYVGPLNLLNALQDVVTEGQVSYIVQLMYECIEHKQCPSYSLLMKIFDICAQSGNTELIIEIQNLCKEKNVDYLTMNSSFNHFLAKAIWMKGNIVKSLNLFKQLYDENPYLRRQIRLMLKHLVADAIENRSEAALLNLVEVSRMLVTNYKDYYLLGCVWQVCFLSEWFSEQQIALDLMENNVKFCEYITNRIPFVISSSLRFNRIEVIYRLLEVLIKHKMKEQYSITLMALLDYQYLHADIRSYNEIMGWCSKNSVKLPSVYHEKYLLLLLDKGQTGVVTKKSSISDRTINLPF